MDACSQLNPGPKGSAPGNPAFLLAHNVLGILNGFPDDEVLWRLIRPRIGVDLCCIERLLVPSE
jgi:hypothetical protein